MNRSRVFRLITGLSCVAISSSGFEAEPTHAALTESAALASVLDDALRRAGLPNGMYSVLPLWTGDLSRSQLAELRDRVRAIDPGAGYAPSADLKMRAIGWLIAGAVLEDVPATRGRHHYLDPVTGRGLDDARAGVSFLTSLLGTLDVGGSFAGMFTGTNFDVTGEPADTWIHSQDNDQSYSAFLAQLRAAGHADSTKESEGRLARALLALGGVLHVLQDMASPSRVRNDFRVAHSRRLGLSFWERMAAFERYVTAAYGSTAPTPGPAGPRRVRLTEFFRSRDGTGLADFTARNFFSPGTLPHSIAVTAGMSMNEREARANESLVRAHPALRGLRGTQGYVPGLVPHLLRFRTHGDRLQFHLDSACYADYAPVLIREAVRSTRDLLAFALRADLRLERDGSAWSVRNKGEPIARGRVDLKWKSAEAANVPARSIDVGPTQAGAELVRIDMAAPKEATHLVAILEGFDATGEPMVAIVKEEIPR